MARSSQNPAQELASAIGAFAEELQDHLTQANSSGKLILPDALLNTLNQYLEQLPLLSGPVSVSSRRLLDARGVELWNGCTRLISQREGEVKLGGLSEVRTFAFALLECAVSSHGSGKIRVLDVAFKAARTCLDNEKLSLCLKILGIAAGRLYVLETSEVDADATRIRSLSTEYYMLRIRLSLLQGRPDIAEHLFSKTPEAKSMEDGKHILETCYKVGKLSLSNGEYDTAAKWLGRALDSSDMQSRQPDPDSKDMRLLVLHAVVQANIHIDTADSRNRLSRVQDTLKEEYGNLFPALMIQLEILSRESPSSEKCFAALIAAIQTMEITDENMNMIIYYIQKLKCWSFDLAVKAFKELLLNRLALSDKPTWIEQWFVTLIWAITEHGTCAQNGLDIIIDFAKSLTDSGQGPLSEEATHASLILIWRAMSMSTSDGKLPDIEKWCNLVLEQPIFQGCSLENKAKFHRKLLSCALASSDVSLSRRILNYMDTDSKSNPLALYFMYKLALLSENSHLGSESLDKLWALDKEHVLSCAAEAQRLEKTGQAIDIFQRVIANLDSCGECINVAGFFQSTICLLSKELEKGEKETNTHKILEEVCTVFEAALFEADKQDSSRENSKFSQDDLGWLFHNAYFLALKSLDFSETEHISRLLDVSGKFATLYQHHLKPEDKTEIHSHHLLCNFLKTLKLVSEARKQSDPARKLTNQTTNYQTIRDTIQTFRSKIPSQLRNKSNTAKERTEWTVKYRTMLAFDFEAAIHLRQWINLPNLIEEAKPIATDKLCCIFLDSILSSDAPIRELLRVVKTIICTNHKTIPTKLPRYLHILFQLSLSPSSTSDAGNTISVAESVLDQILALARKSNTKPNPKTTQAATTAATTARSYYPNDELEWLATTAFNRAVDFYRDSADADCLRWAGKAIEVAELVRGDGEGVLVGLLRRNLSVLGIS